MWLQKSGKNALFNAITAAGLYPSDFDMDIDGEEVRLRHRWSTSYFTMGGGLTPYHGTHVVGDGPSWTHEPHSWSNAVERFGRWVAEVKLDIETPDLWADLQREEKLFAAISGGDIKNTPFTLAEQNEIASRLQKLTERVIRTYSLSPEQVQDLHARLGYAVTATGRSGRVDWLSILIGTLTIYVLTAALPPESARGIFVEFMHAIGHLYGLPLLPSP